MRVPTDLRYPDLGIYCDVLRTEECVALMLLLEISVCSYCANNCHPPQDAPPMFFPNPSVSRPASHLTEEEQVKIAKRMGLITHLPCGIFDGTKKSGE